MPPGIYDRTVSLDFETYSEAGFRFNAGTSRWESISAGQQGGLPAVGADVYAEHPSTEVLVACYQFDGGAMQSWVLGMAPPNDLLDHVSCGGLVVAYNSRFEYLIWRHVCLPKYGWPVLHLANTRDTMARARAYSLPGKMSAAAKALGQPLQKDPRGDSLIRYFSVPRSPTKGDGRLRNHLGQDFEKAQALYRYCAQDVLVEAQIGQNAGALSGYEIEVWKVDQSINDRGVFVDLDAIERCQEIVADVSKTFTAEFNRLTGGEVTSSDQVQKTVSFLAARGVDLPNLQADTVSEALDDPFSPVNEHPWARRMLEIRRDLAHASVKKLNAIRLRASADGRVRGLFAYCGAACTGRWAGRGPQPQNLPRDGCKTRRCDGCGAWQGAHRTTCVDCGGADVPPAKWGFSTALAAIASFRDGDASKAENRWGDVLAAVAGCLRSLFVAAPGHRLICSDYRAIEAVVLAVVAGEQWRVRVFQTHGKIYEQSASRITGVPLDDYLEYKRRTGEHHPDRQKIGKVAELASGYQGWVSAWKRFGAAEYMTDEEIKENVLKWRRESPMIRALWKGLERAVIEAVSFQGHMATYREIRYRYDGRVLRCYLPSGRALVYHSPSLELTTRYGRPHTLIKFFGHNSNPLQGPLGWVEQTTYGGRLTENICQAISRDIQAHGMLNAERAGYPIVLHVHDEIVCECPDGQGTVEELERCMGDLPTWAKGWPVIAHGGWEGREYRKD